MPEANVKLVFKFCVVDFTCKRSNDQAITETTNKKLKKKTTTTIATIKKVNNELTIAAAAQL